MKKLSIILLFLSSTIVIADDKILMASLNENLILKKEKLINHFSTEKKNIINFQKKSWEKSKLQLTQNLKNIKTLLNIN